jgi:gliding motility-associated-like protein
MKSTTFRLVLALAFATALFRSANADHIIGSDMTYECADTPGVYTIIFNFYRDCNGCYVLGQSPRCGTSENCGSSSTAPTNLSLRCITPGKVQSLGTVTMTRTSIVDITTTCNSAKSRCEQPCNGTFPHGIEKHTFEGTIDVRSKIASGGCDFEISVRLAVRNAGITTGQSQQWFYTSCEINACAAPCNSSPKLSNDPVAILCCDQPFTFNNGAVDTSDRDSISYSFVKAFQNRGSECTYATPRTYLDPITSYYPPGTGYPQVVPGASPPIGTYLDAVSGDLIFTPTNCSEVAVVVIQMTEWRKDSVGVYQQIGVTRRDMQVIVMSCPSNNPPIVEGPYTYNVCEGSQLCFNVTTDDPAYVPPPPTPLPPPDSVKITWNSGIPGATFSVITASARLQSGRFCWTPAEGMASSLPYNFTVTARDNACPLNALSVRSFRVTVKPKARGLINIDTMDCGVYPHTVDLETGFRGNGSYLWTVLDSNRLDVLDRDVFTFASNGNIISTRKSDTLKFKKGGKYFVRLNLNNSPLNCPNTYEDTLIVPPLLEADLSIGADTFVCAGTALTFSPYLANVNPPVSYQWSTMGVTDNGIFINNATANVGDTNSTFDLTIPTVQYDTAVSVFVRDASGCTAEDTIQVFLKANPLAVLPPDVRLCAYDSINIVPNLDSAYWIDPIMGDTLVQGDTLYKEWFYNGSTTPFSIEDSVTINIAGMYVIRIEDSLKCTDTDTIFLFVNDTVTALAGPDQVSCFNDSFDIVAGGLDTAGNSKSGLYQWYKYRPLAADSLLGTNDSYKIRSINSVNYRLQLYVTEGGVVCQDDDSMSVLVNQLPIVQLDNVGEVCCDYGPILLDNQILAPVGGPHSTGGWSTSPNPSLIDNSTFQTADACGLIVAPAKFIRTSLVYTYQEPSTLCINKDSFIITVNGLPNTLLKEKQYCQDIGSIPLDNEVVLSPANTSLGFPSWRCLDSNSANNNFTADMLENRGFSFAPDWWLNVGESDYEIQNDNEDTITLEFSFTNAKGCSTKDTIDMVIAKVPKLTFSSHRDLCISEGEISLKDLMGVNLNDGTWSVVDTSSGALFRNPALLGGIANGDTINTLASTPLATFTTTPNSWWIRYTHTATGCPTFKDTFLRINPLPRLTLDPLSPRYCETNADIRLSATPSGSTGIWSATDPSALVGGNTFSPSSATLFNTAITFYYTYTNPATGCSNTDSIASIVDLEPTLNLPPDETYCLNTPTETSRILTLPISGANTSGVSWFGANTYGNVARIATGSIDPVQNTGTITFTLQNQKADTFRIVGSAGGLGSCAGNTDKFEIIFNPLPDLTITNSNPNGCDPVTTDLGVVINNVIDPATSDYTWTATNSTTATSTNSTVSNTFSGGNGDITLTVTSLAGCSSTITDNVLVYPIPNASFVPNPNNFTTAALPRFIFTDKSTVDDANGSFIDQYEWDFGDMLIDTDTATAQNPSWYYSTDTATYCVNLKVTTNYGCINDTTSCVIVGPDLIVFIPNAFTPNISGPEENEGFSAIISGHKLVKLVIFNRWGEIMYRTSEVQTSLDGTIKTKPWNGTYNGNLAQQDVYAYQLVVTALNDEEYTYSGTITLIR